MNSERMIEYEYQALPKWIQSSSLCLAQLDNNDNVLNNDCDDDIERPDDSIIVCPSKYSDFSVNIDSNDDMLRVLDVIDYWGVKHASIPYDIFEYLFNHDDCIDIIEQSLQYDLEILEKLKTVQRTFNFLQSSHNNSLSVDICRLMTMLKCDLIHVYQDYVKISLIDVGIGLTHEIVMLACQHGSLLTLKELPQGQNWLSTCNEVCQ